MAELAHSKDKKSLIYKTSNQKKLATVGAGVLDSGSRKEADASIKEAAVLHVLGSMSPEAIASPLFPIV